MERTYTQDEIAKIYAAAMDSVNLLNAGKPEEMSAESWADMEQRNKDHLALVVEWPHMQGQNLAPLNAVL